MRPFADAERAEARGVAWGSGDDEAGVTLIITVMISAMVFVLATVLVNQAIAQATQARDSSRDDQAMATAEAHIDRYATKLAIAPEYYRLRVDEAERARTCTEVGHPSFGVVVSAGEDWLADCSTWEYQLEPGDEDWFAHPLIGGTDDIRVLIEVTPPDSGGTLAVRSVVRDALAELSASVSATFDAPALSQFLRVTQSELAYGGDVVVSGPVYSGSDVSFEAGVEVAANVYAEGEVLGACPTTSGGADLYDSGSGNCGADDIRRLFPLPVAFGNLGDDLDRIQALACDGTGVCLDEGYDAYLVHPVAQGDEGRLAVWGSSTPPPPHASCSAESEDAWWLQVQDPTVSWTSLGTFSASGVVWADGHVIFGNRGPTPAGPSGSAVTVAESLTVLAGTPAAPRNLIVNTDVVTSGEAVVGLIGSDEVIVNPYAVGADGSLEIEAALLAHQDQWRVAQYCGDSGAYVRFAPDGSVTSSSSDAMASLSVRGSMASPSSTNVSGSFSPRTYEFDERLATRRPPHYPLIGGSWAFSNWTEEELPAWARN